MQMSLAHLQINVATANLPFYRDLAAFLGLATIFADDAMLGVSTNNGASIWFTGATKDVTNDYDGPGLNHLGLGASTIADVDAVVAYLGKAGVACRFETPRHRPDFAENPESTYYQVMFESPDRILFEVVYTGPK